MIPSQKKLKSKMCFFYSIIFSLCILLAGCNNFNFNISAHPPVTPATPLPPQPFISTWTVPANSLTITLPLVEHYNYDFVIDWGDGTPPSTITAWDSPNITHTYAEAGNYVLTMEGTLEAWSFNNLGDKNKIIHIEDLGRMGWKSFKNAFNGCSNLTYIYGGVTDDVTDMSGMFSGAVLAEPDTSNWNTSKVTNMAGMFNGARVANPDTSGWETKNVTDMSHLFRFTSKATPDTSRWDTSKVTDMSYMFRFADLANPDTRNWDTSKVTSMVSMFRGALSFRGDVANWDVSNVTNMVEMFLDTNVNVDVSRWRTPKLVVFNHMFQNALSANPDMSGWDFSQVTNMSYLLGGTTALTVENYSALLIRAAATYPLTGAGMPLIVTVKYNASAVTARANLVSRGWHISDGGLEP